MSDSVTGTEAGEEAAAAQENAADTGYDPAAPAPLEVPRTPTGDAGADAALERLGDADHLTTDGHLQVYEDVHRELRDALTALDARPGPPAPPPPYRPSYQHRS
ncbi:hypothetical protein [Streptomyces kebangsaanensis]|uniref:Uncharacterized protein n=1 Tax=Streptomyces kebangsaanensis TaxID=864058 RepID=A0ABW6KQP7_9ACTN|nr:hypothetical protein [Streptomyces kebangsaanensis]